MLDALMQPRSIAVVGASRTPHTIGYQILDILVRHGYTGAVYPVNPSTSSVHSIRAYPGVEAIPAPVDLAVVVVPKQHVQAVAEACGRWWSSPPASARSAARASSASAPLWRPCGATGKPLWN